MSDAQFLWTQFGFAGLTLCVLVFLATRLFSLWLASKEKDHQKSLDIQKETHIESLRRIGRREEIRFTKLHEERADVIKQLYLKLCSMDVVGKSYMNSEIDTDLFELFKKSSFEFYSFYKDNKLFFHPNLCAKLEKIRDDLAVGVFIKQEILIQKTGEVKEREIANINARWRHVEKEIDTAKTEIETEFRRLIGVDVT